MLRFIPAVTMKFRSFSSRLALSSRSACGSDAEFQRITAEMGLDAEADKQAFRGEMLSVKVRASTVQLLTAAHWLLFTPASCLYCCASDLIPSLPLNLCRPR